MTTKPGPLGSAWDAPEGTAFVIERGDGRQHLLTEEDARWIATEDLGDGNGYRSIVEVEAIGAGWSGAIKRAALRRGVSL